VKLKAGEGLCGHCASRRRLGWLEQYWSLLSFIKTRIGTWSTVARGLFLPWTANHNTWIEEMGDSCKILGRPGTVPHSTSSGRNCHSQPFAESLSITLICSLPAEYSPTPCQIQIPRVVIVLQESTFQKFNAGTNQSFWVYRLQGAKSCFLC